MAENFLTLRQVMKKYGKTYTQVRYATETGRLRAVKMGWQWFFQEDELPESWPEAPRKQLRGKSIDERG